VILLENSETKMIKIITGEFCSRCHLISPLLKKYAEENNMSFEEKDINNATPEEIEGASMLPVIYFWDKRVEYDEALKKVMA